MSSYQLAAVAVGIGIVWYSTKLFRAIVRGVFPQGLPGEKNTSLLASSRPASSPPVTATDLEDVVEYDYIIVGTGTAGCVLANRLTEDANTRVLAIEAGHSDLKQIMSRMPAGLTKLWKTSVDWSFTTTPQPGCDGRELDWPRGKIIGGCSSINGMIYSRGSPDDYDEWERLGNKGWGYKDVLQYFLKAERFTQPEDSGRRLPPEDLAQHGNSGLWNVRYSWPSELSQMFPDACSEIGIEKTPDFNCARGILGTSTLQTFIDNLGQRASTAVAYLTADVVKRPNLKIASGQTVTRLIFNTHGPQPRAVGVEMAASKSATVRFLAKAKNEILLCSGTIGSPQLLKISGIGPEKELNDHGIALVKKLSGVGENLMDHVAFSNLVFKTDPEVSAHRLQHPIKNLPAVAEWFRSGTGPMIGQGCDAAAFIRTAGRDDLLPSLKGIDRASGVKSADLELLCFPVCFTANGSFIAPFSDGYCQMSSVSLRPEARGTIKLASSNIFDKPKIDTKALSNDYDINIILYGLRLCIKIAKSETYRKYFKGWYQGPHHSLDWDSATDEEIKAQIRKHCETLYHPMGTAKMGSGPDAVVDDQLRVHGVIGLRVIDASICPTALACHPCAPVVMMAEKAADMIKSERV